MRAKIQLLLDQPFWGTLLINLRYKEDTKGLVTKTMATDGKSLWWYPPFVDAESERAIVCVLAHEAAHCCLLHPLRRQHRHPRAWNVAADEAVNNLLEDCNDAAKANSKGAPFEWPKCGHILTRAHKGKSAEEIYNDLPQFGGGGQGQQGAGTGDDDNDFGMGGVLDAPGNIDEQKQHEADWKMAVTQAAQAAKMQGKLPAGLERLVDDLISPPPRWQDLLREFIRNNAKDDYSWQKINRRYAASGFILPTLYSQRMGRLAIAIDTSGSIDGELLNQFVAEVQNVMHECRPEKVVLIDCDAEVNSIRELEPFDEIPRDFKGGGGTDFRPVFAAIADDPPVAVIYLTDMEGSFPEQDPGIPTFWCSYGNDTQAPFGTTVRIV